MSLKNVIFVINLAFSGYVFAENASVADPNLYDKAKNCIISYRRSSIDGKKYKICTEANEFKVIRETGQVTSYGVIVDRLKSINQELITTKDPLVFHSVTIVIQDDSNGSGDKGYVVVDGNHSDRYSITSVPKQAR